MAKHNAYTASMNTEPRNEMGRRPGLQQSIDNFNSPAAQEYIQE